MNSSGHWDEIFEAVPAEGYYAKPPNPDIVKVAGLLAPGSSALDLGCGMGGSDIYLAERGFEVTAVDFSEVATKALAAESLRRGANVEVRREDVRDFRFEKQYDLVIAHGIFQFLDRTVWDGLVSESKSHTNPGGLNLVAVFTDKVPTPPDMEHAIGDVFREGELFELYADWEAVSKESYVKEDEHPGGIKHRHPIEKIIARKSK